MQHPLEIGAHYYPPDAHQDQRSHRYRSFMIEEILTDHPNHKVSSPTGDLLKFGVHALLSARPYHNHLGKYRDLSVRRYFEIRHGQYLNLLLIQGHSNCTTSRFAYSQGKDSTLSLRTNTKQIRYLRSKYIQCTGPSKLVQIANAHSFQAILHAFHAFLFTLWEREFLPARA